MSHCLAHVLNDYELSVVDSNISEPLHIHERLYLSSARTVHPVLCLKCDKPIRYLHVIALNEGDQVGEGGPARNEGEDKAGCTVVMGR
jgi:hypothetical protein